MCDELSAKQLALEVEPLDDLTFEEWFVALPSTCDDEHADEDESRQ